MNEITSASGIKSRVEGIKNYKVVLWKYDGLYISNSDNEGDTIDWDTLDIQDVIRLRAFNTNEEIHIWRSNKRLFFREQDDLQKNVGHDEKNKIAREMIVMGSVKDKLENQWKEFKGIGDRKIAIKTYHYFNKVNELGQVGYVDMRFVEFKKV